MNRFKEFRNKAVELTKKSCDDEKIIREIKEADNKKQLAFKLLDCGKVEVFVKIYSSKERRRFWNAWSNEDYAKFNISYETLLMWNYRIDKNITLAESDEDKEQIKGKLIISMASEYLNLLRERELYHKELLMKIHCALKE